MPWQVGDYTTDGEKPFDQGSFGTVWKARRRSDGARVALKLVLLTDTPDARERIAAERHGAMLQQQFEQAHGMVPKVYEFGQDGHDLFIAMEFVEGGALSELVKQGPVDPRTAAGYAARICDFLDRAHGFATAVEGEPYDRLVHADLKPGHVLVSPSGDIKVLDFGIAKALAKTTQVTTNNWGTSAYASPERLDRGHVNEHVDFWSLGVILYEMLAGHRPYPDLDRNRSALEHAIRTNAPRRPLPDACPPDLAAIVNKLLAYQIERRYQSADEIKTDLERFLSGEAPLAMAGYATDATVPIARSPVPSDATRPLGSDVPPTEPLPAAGAAPSAPAPATQAAPRRRFARVRRLARKAALIFLLLALIRIVMGEAFAWFASERFREGLTELEGRTISAARAHYDSIRDWGVLDMGLRLRVHRPLKTRLLALADAVIADYRREEPTMGPAEWRQAQQALQWAAQLAPRDHQLVARLLTADAHVIRLGARNQTGAAARQIYNRAVERFRAAAEQDSTSFDPYLGISRIAVYGLGDVDGAMAAIEDAIKRGYVAGRRERALLGDGFLRRGNASRALARTLSGDQRQRELERARADYVSCIEAFDGILGFGYSAKNMETCKRQLERIEDELEIERVRRDRELERERLGRELKALGRIMGLS